MKSIEKLVVAVLLLCVTYCHPPSAVTEKTRTEEYRDLELRDSLRHRGRNRDRLRHEGRSERAKLDRHRIPELDVLGYSRLNRVVRKEE